MNLFSFLFPEEKNISAQKTAHRGAETFLTSKLILRTPRKDS